MASKDEGIIKIDYKNSTIEVIDHPDHGGDWTFRIGGPGKKISQYFKSKEQAVREAKHQIDEYAMSASLADILHELDVTDEEIDAALEVYASSSRHCSFYKASNGKWYMELARREYGGREDSDCYGPFPDEASALKYLDRFSNPGGYDTDESGTDEPPKKAPNGNPVIKP